jgi:hypothetical protein
MRGAVAVLCIGAALHAKTASNKELQPVLRILRWFAQTRPVPQRTPTERLRPQRLPIRRAPARQ